MRFEKVRSEPLDFPINCPPLSNGIEWTGCEKIRKDNSGGLVSEPILNHKMNQYWYYVKFWKEFLASANMSAFTPVII